MKVHSIQLTGRSLCSIRSNRKWCKRRGSSLQCQNCFFVYTISDCNLKNLFNYENRNLIPSLSISLFYYFHQKKRYIHQSMTVPLSFIIRISYFYPILTRFLPTLTFFKFGQYLNPSTLLTSSDTLLKSKYSRFSQ